MWTKRLPKKRNENFNLVKIYTKAGDRGTTSLLGGNLVPKDHPRLEACGTLDELNSWLGLLRDQLSDEDMRQTLLGIQDRIMVGSTILANERKDMAVSVPEIREEDVSFLEGEIDRMDQELDPLQSFILPGGHTTVSYCHLARSTCRRAERYSINVFYTFYYYCAIGHDSQLRARG